jgi:hypothetical protein
MVVGIYDNELYHIPDSYNELTRDQLIKLAPLLTRKDEPGVIGLQVLQVLLQLSKVKFFFLDTEVKEQLLPFTAWVFEKNNLTKQIIPVYSHWLNSYWGPKSDFDNITLSEYHCTEIYYAMLLQDKKPEALDALISVLYRKSKPGYDFKKDPDGDCRRDFNEHEIEYWSKKVSSLPSDLKQAILLWYDGCRESLVQLYPAVFRPSDSAEASDTKGMFSVMRGLADGAKYGSFNEVKKLNLHTALMEMEQLIKEAEEQKKLVKND